MNQPQSLETNPRQSHENLEPSLSPHVEQRRSKTRAALIVALAMSLSGCVYHRRGSNRPHLLEYENQDAKVVFPWRTNEAFRKEYEFAILATIASYLSYPVEALDGIARLKIERIFYLIPAIFYALENDVDDIERATRNAQELRESRPQDPSEISSNARNR